MWMVLLLLPHCLLLTDLVMLARNELEAVLMLVVLVILPALLCPHAPTIEVALERLRHALNVPIHEELERREVQDQRALASEAVSVDKRSRTRPMRRSGSFAFGNTSADLASDAVQLFHGWNRFHLHGSWHIHYSHGRCHRHLLLQL